MEINDDLLWRCNFKL